jgi:hypothetical protein
MVVILVQISGFMDGEECPSVENPIPCWSYVIYRYKKKRMFRCKAKGWW